MQRLGNKPGKNQGISESEADVSASLFSFMHVGLKWGGSFRQRRESNEPENRTPSADTFDRSAFRRQPPPSHSGTMNPSEITTPGGDNFPAADLTTAQKDCKNEKPVSSRTLFL